MESPFFTRQVNRLISQFGEKNFSGERLSRLKVIFSRYPDECVEFCVNLALDRCKLPPVPNEFPAFIDEWKIHFKKKYGRPWYSQSEEGQDDDKIACDRCLGSGVVRIFDFGSTEAKSLIWCDCEWGLHWSSSMKQYRLPMYESKMSAVWLCSAPPMDWFKPKGNAEDMSGGSLMGNSEFIELKNNYLRRLKKAHNFWANEIKRRNQE